MIGHRYLFSPAQSRFALFAGIWLVFFFITGCDRSPTDRIQGYVEGEFVYVASPVAGRLDLLSVERGSSVSRGNPLFTLENALETAVREEAQSRLSQARANLEDARKGKRPSEVQSLQAQLDQARSALDYAEKQFTRVEGLLQTKAVSIQDFDQTRSDRDQAQRRVAQLEADLKTARLGLREDQITAAEAEVHAREAAFAQAQWNLSQKHQDATQSALVIDILYRPGEWVAAGHPVVSLLPPENIKVRAFVPEPRIGSFQLGDAVRVSVDGVVTPFAGKVSFISPRAEYTPPVIFSQESRDKLVFMVEVVFDPATAIKLHPGQPVDLVKGP